MALEDTVPVADDDSPIKNYAKNPTLVERVVKELIPRCRTIRDARAPLEAQWASFHKAWTMEHESRGYDGHHDIYLPAANKVVETLVSQLVAATFPGDEFFNVEATKSAWQSMSADVRALEMQRVRNARVRSHAEAFYRQLLIKGNSPARVHWAELKKRGKLRKSSVKDAERLLLGQGSEDHSYTIFEGPMFTTLKAEDVYFWPENISHIESALIAFEVVSTTRKALLYEARRNKTYVEDTVRELKGERDTTKQSNDQETLASHGYTGETELHRSDRVDIVHCYTDMDLSAAEEDDEHACVPVCVTFTWGGKVLRIVEADAVCPGRIHPFVLGRMGTIVGRVHGTGVVERIHPLQLLLNDQMNQAMDCATYALNPIILTNPDAVQGVLPDLEPGVQMLVRDVNSAMKFDRPPTDLIQSGSMLMTQTMSWMQDFGGAPPVLSGGSTPGRAFKTATGIGTAQQNATTPLQQMVRLCEVDVWEPMLQGFWLLDQRFATEEVLIEQGGMTLGDPKYMDPMSKYGEYKFRWLASTQASNQQVMAQQVQQLIQMLSSPAIIQVLQQEPAPKRLVISPLIERIIRTFGLRDVERILVDGKIPTDAVPGVDAPEQGQQQQPMMPGLESLAGAQGQDPGGQFGAMRMGANELAGAFGQMLPQNGGGQMMLPDGSPVEGMEDLPPPF